MEIVRGVQNARIVGSVCVEKILWDVVLSPGCDLELSKPDIRQLLLDMGCDKDCEFHFMARIDDHIQVQAIHTRQEYGPVVFACEAVYVDGRKNYRVDYPENSSVVKRPPILWRWRRSLVGLLYAWLARRPG